MTVGKIDCMRGSRFAGVVFAGMLGAVGFWGSSLPAAADDGQDALNVASLEQLPDGSMADERGGAITSKFNLNFYLHAIATVSGEVKFQKDIPEQGTLSQTTSQFTSVTTTTTSTKTTSAP
jgi:hypothetical protein